MKVRSTKQVQTCLNIEPREKKKEYQPKCIMQTEANNKKTDENWEKNGEVQVRHNFITISGLYNIPVGFYIRYLEWALWNRYSFEFKFDDTRFFSLYKAETANRAETLQRHDATKHFSGIIKFEFKIILVS